MSFSKYKETHLRSAFDKDCIRGCRRIGCEKTKKYFPFTNVWLKHQRRDNLRANLLCLRPRILSSLSCDGVTQGTMRLHRHVLFQSGMTTPFARPYIRWVHDGSSGHNTDRELIVATWANTNPVKGKGCLKNVKCNPNDQNKIK